MVTADGTTAVRTMVGRYVLPWWLMALLGLSSVVLGLLTLVWPGRTLLVMVVLLGIHLLVFGAMRFVWALADDELPQRGFVALMGILGVVAGLVVLRRPFETLAVLALILGVYWVFSGLLDVFTAIGDENEPNRALLGLRGLLGTAAGVVVVLWPGITLLAIAVIAGVNLVSMGVVEILLANRLRQAPAGDAG